MAIVESVDTLARLIVPNFYNTIVGATSQMRFVSLTAEIDTVNSCLMAYQCIVRCAFGGTHAPDFDRTIETGTSEHVRVLRVDRQLHDIVYVIGECVDALPILVPVIHLDSVVIRA